MATQDKIVSLYSGQHTITYRNGNHTYYLEDGTAIPSVTTIMGKVLAKPDLMLWPLNLALRYLEEKLPQYITKDDLEMARTAHVRKREGGANTGTAVHYLAEQRLHLPRGKRLPLESDTLPEEVVMAAIAFENWYIEVDPDVVGVEQIVYSPTLTYVGTYDSILTINGKTYLCDVKTTNASKAAPRGIYPEHFIQMGAYYAAYEEQRLYELAHGGTLLKPIDDFMVISVKKSGRVDTLALSTLNLTPQELASTWRSTIELYTRMNDLKRRIGGKP